VLLLVGVEREELRDYEQRQQHPGEVELEVARVVGQPLLVERLRHPADLRETAEYFMFQPIHDLDLQDTQESTHNHGCFFSSRNKDEVAGQTALIVYVFLMVFSFCDFGAQFSVEPCGDDFVVFSGYFVELHFPNEVEHKVERQQ